VSEDEVQSRGDDRLLTFEVAGTVYALPISEVLEVVESGNVTCVPTLPRSHGGVMNWHGEALPVVTPALLLDCGDPVETTEDSPDAQYLVVTDRPDESARLGLPIDRVVGLVDGHGGGVHGPNVVAERKPVDGRVVSVINPRRLVERAAKVIEGAVD
jgi:chemotaxis signal transduction protein